MATDGETRQQPAVSLTSHAHLYNSSSSAALHAAELFINISCSTTTQEHNNNNKNKKKPRQKNKKKSHKQIAKGISSRRNTGRLARPAAVRTLKY
jgi:hypothetical protein